MNNSIKIGLSILLFLCLLDMPYGYFQLVIFLSLIGFSVLAYSAHKKGQKSEFVIYIALAILFQPLIKISLGRTLWNIVDLIVAVGLLYKLETTKDKAKKMEID